MNQFFGLLLMVGYVLARPASYDEYLALEDDVAAVGSLRRDVRAPVPVGFATEVEDLLSAGSEARRSRQAKSDKEPKKTAMKNASGKSDEGGYYKTYGSDAEGEKGYLKQTYSKGDHGYKTLDTFHKQDGDNYGFEKHTAFGKAKGGEEGGKHGKSGSYSSNEGSHDNGDHEGAGTIVDTHYVPAGGDHAVDTEGENYSEGDAAASEGDVGYYSEGGDVGHYSDGGEGGEGGHHTSGGEGDSGSYSTGGSSGEHYSSGSEGEGSHGTHGSYSTGDDSGDHQGYSDAEYEGDHY